MKKENIDLKKLKTSELKAFNKISGYLNEIKSIMGSNNEYEAQRKIEESWVELAKDSIVDSTLFQKEGNIIMDAFLYLEDIFKKRGRRLNLPFKDELLKVNYVIITFSFILLYYKNNSLNNIAIKIAENIVFRIWLEEKTDSFEEFQLSHNLDQESLVKIGLIFVELFTGFAAPNQVFSQVMEHDSPTVLRINAEYEKKILESIIIRPQALPMICKPNKWSKTEYGGFLENTKLRKSLKTGSSYHNHVLEKTDNLYNAINYLNCQQFSVNMQLLDYLEKDGYYLIENCKDNDPENYLKLLITLQIAETYRNVVFYLNTNVDWRSRIYTISFYLSYQGSDLSLALLNLANGKILNEDGLMNLYIYGANCFNDNNISKRPFSDRIDWVKNNLDKIIEMSPEFILKAENVFLFTAFALTLKKYMENPKSPVFMPVFMDATCSGIQHFAAILMDNDLAKDVNLTDTDEVRDIYSKLVPPINVAIRKFGEENIIYEHFKEINLGRKELKRAIMTKTYNVSVYGICEQLKSIAQKEEFIKENPKIKQKQIKLKKYIFPSRKKNAFVSLTSGEVFRLAEIINQNIFNAFPILEEIYRFLTSIAKIMLKFDIPITWATPSGLKITQHYKQSETKKYSITILGRNKTIVLKNWISNSVDKRKQVSAIIPNIIHSFDASHLIEIINAVSESNIYILPIHDCYGTHPNDMDRLAYEVRLQFIKIYAGKNFLETLRDKLKFELKTHAVDVKVSPDGSEYVEYQKSERKIEKILIPNIPKLGNYDIKEILKSKYTIC